MIKSPIKFLSLFFLITVTVWGNEARNGGQLVAARFVAKGWEILRHLEYVQTDLLDEKQRIDLQLGIYNTKVIAIPGPLKSNEGLFVDVRVVTDAQGNKTIELDTDKWKELINEPTVNMIILHEYLRVTQLNDDQYQFSSRLKMDVSGKPSFGPGVYENNGGLFQLTPEGLLTTVKNGKWPFVFNIPDYTHERTFSFVMSFPHRFHYNAKEERWEGTAQTKSYYCDLTATVYVRTFENSKALEMTILHPTRLYNSCEAFGNEKLILSAQKTH